MSRSFRSRSRSFLLVVPALAVALLALPARAQAQGNHFVLQPYRTQILLADGQVVAVSEARTDVGAPVIQWDNTGGNEQFWFEDEVRDRFDFLIGYVLRNKNSNLCMATDSVAGDQLFQAPCNPDDLTQVYLLDGGLANLGTGLLLDVWGASTWRGAPIDLWRANLQWNQFVTLTTYYFGN